MRLNLHKVYNEAIITQIISLAKGENLEKVDFILSHGTVITMNDSFDVIFDGAVAIRKHEIVAVDTSENITKDYTANETIDCRHQYIMPGLINAHTHVPMTLLRGMADDLRLDVWLIGYIMPVEREFVSEEFCRLGTQLALAEMIRGGVTTFADMYYFEDDIAQTTADVGLRAVLGETVLKFPAPDAETYEDSLKYARDFIQKWLNHPLITATVAPHAPYSNTDYTLSESAKLAKEFDVPILTHIAETQREVDDCVQETGERVVPYVKSVGLLDTHVLMAHCVHISEQEMRMMLQTGSAVAHCPSANLKLASGIAPVAQMLEMGLTIAIGTDGPASNNDLDMFEEMRLAALIAKVNPTDPTALPARQALQMATRNGAKALKLEAVTGSLEVGKFADIIVVDAETTHNLPHYNVNPNAVYSQLVYATKSHDVQHVWCHGQLLMKDRELQTIDENKVLRQSKDYANRIGKFLGAREEDVLSKLVAISVGVERVESFEIQVKARLTDESAIEDLLSDERVEVLRAVHYRQYDTYFVFNENERVRYREDDRLDANGNVENVRMRLTYTSGEKEEELNPVVLSRSRFIAPANQPLRFYSEYFAGSDRVELTKVRRRWHILYKDVKFYVNIDRIIEPKTDELFVELKARTWSRSDAESKAQLINEMMQVLQISASDTLHADYLDIEM